MTRARRWVRRNPLMATFVALVVWAMAVGYAEDVQSCQRTRLTRETQATNVPVLRDVLSHDQRLVERADPGYAGWRAARLAELTNPPVPPCFPWPGT